MLHYKGIAPITSADDTNEIKLDVPSTSRQENIESVSRRYNPHLKVLVFPTVCLVLLGFVIATFVQVSTTKRQQGNPGDTGVVLRQQGKSAKNQSDFFQHTIRILTSVDRGHRLLKAKDTVQNELGEDNFIKTKRGHNDINDDWIALFNGFQYKFLGRDINFNFMEARSACHQLFGADVIVDGFQNVKIRKILYELFLVNTTGWIGITNLPDKKYLNWIQTYPQVGGKQLDNSLIEEYFGRPVDGSTCNCVHSDMLFSHCQSCDAASHVICEKKLNLKQDEKNKIGKTSKILKKSSILK